MAIIKCPNDHYYDNAKYNACPHCQVTGGSRRMEEEMTIARVSEEIRLINSNNIGFSNPGGEEKTIGIYKTKMQADPVVGWLVCIKGAGRGRDYRLHTGRNFLGRGLKMDICITEDDTITRENHCSVVFDPKGKVFYISPGEGSITYLNDKLLDDSGKLSEGDVITAGLTDLVFIPYCKEGRTWL